MRPITLVYGAQAVARRVRSLAAEIAAALPQDFLMVVTLKGAFVFAADLVRELHRLGVRPRVAFVRLSSYGASTESSGSVALAGDLTDDVSAQVVLLVDDVADTGRTLAYAKDLLRERGAAEVRVCVLLDKPERRTVELRPDFVGFTIGNVFVVGYGIDYAERYRHLPYIAKLTEARPQSDGSGRRRRARSR